MTKALKKIFLVICVVGLILASTNVGDIQTKAAGKTQVVTTTQACSVWTQPCTDAKYRLKTVPAGTKVTVYTDMIPSTKGDGKTFYKTIKGAYILQRYCKLEISSCVPTDWSQYMATPSAQQIKSRNRIDKVSPYVSGWMHIPDQKKFTQYCIDFKADKTAIATYCSLYNFHLDYSPLLKKYKGFHQDGYISGYGGFQVCDSMSDRRTIASFWDVYCEDFNGNTVVHRPVRTYPAKTKYTEDFDGEGEGAHVLVDYPWEDGEWYRMLIQCGTSKKTGNTTISQWVCKVSEKKWTLLSEYDLGVSGVTFQGSVGVFLENYYSNYSGYVRTMEVKNARYYSDGEWIMIDKCDEVSPFIGDGSYNFGSSPSALWFITTGVYGYGKNPNEGTYTVPYDETGSPI